MTNLKEQILKWLEEDKIECEDLSSEKNMMVVLERMPELEVDFQSYDNPFSIPKYQMYFLVYSLPIIISFMRKNYDLTINYSKHVLKNLPDNDVLIFFKQEIKLILINAYLSTNKEKEAFAMIEEFTKWLGVIGEDEIYNTSFRILRPWLLLYFFTLWRVGNKKEALKKLREFYDRTTNNVWSLNYPDLHFEIYMGGLSDLLYVVFYFSFVLKRPSLALQLLEEYNILHVLKKERAINDKDPEISGLIKKYREITNEIKKYKIKNSLETMKKDSDKDSDIEKAFKQAAVRECDIRSNEGGNKEEIEKLEKEEEELLKEIKEKNPLISAVYERPEFKIEDIQQELDDNAAVLEFYIGKPFLNNWEIVDVLNKFVFEEIFKNTPVFLYALYVDKLNVAMWSWEIKVKEKKNMDDILKYIKREIDKGSIFLPQKLGDLKSKKRIVIVPIKETLNIPLHLMKIEGGERLIDFASVSYLPTAIPHMVSLMKERSVTHRIRQKLKAPNILLAYYTDENLKKTKNEINNLKELFTKELMMPRIRVYPPDNSKKSEEDFLKILSKKSYDVVHIASHAYYDEEQPENSGIVIKNSVVTIQDIESTQINADLIFINSCEAGNLSIKEGNLIGIVSSLIFAGAKAVVAPTEMIPDTEETVKFTETFYKKYLKTKDVAESLAKAQRSILEKLEKEKKRKPQNKNKIENLKKLLSYRYWGI